MSFEQKWDRMQERICLSYIAIAVVLFILYLYIFFSFSKKEFYMFFFLFGAIYSLIERYREKKDFKNIMYILLPSSLIIFLLMTDFVNNTLLLFPFFPGYLYLMLPFIAEYKKQKNRKSRIYVTGKIIFFLVFFFISLLRIAGILL